MTKTTRLTETTRSTVNYKQVRPPRIVIEPCREVYYHAFPYPSYCFFPVIKIKNSRAFHSPFSSGIHMYHSLFPSGVHPYNPYPINNNTSMAFHSPFPFGILPYRHLQHHKSVMFLCILYRAFCGSLIRVSSRLVSNPCSRVPFAWTTRSSLIRMCSSLHTLTLSATRVHVERCRGPHPGLYPIVSTIQCKLWTSGHSHLLFPLRVPLRDHTFLYVLLAWTARVLFLALPSPHVLFLALPNPQRYSA